MHTIITGASSGIGEALAKELRRRGHRLTLVARRRALLEQLAAGHEQDTHVVEADLSDVSRVPEVVASARRALGPVDVLVNNAGVQIVAAAASTKWEDGERLLRVDLHTPLRLTLEVLPVATSPSMPREGDQVVICRAVTLIRAARPAGPLGASSYEKVSTVVKSTADVGRLAKEMLSAQ